MDRLGADVGALEAAGQQLARFAAQVDEARGRIDRQVAWMPWVGADASAFRARWNRIAVGDLQVLSTDLHDAHIELQRQAEQQRAASDSRRGAALSLAAIGGTSAGGLVAASVTSRSSAARILGRMTPGPAMAAGWVTGAGLAHRVLLGHARGVAASTVPRLVRSVPREVAATVLGSLAGAVVAGPAGAVVGAVIGYRWASGASDGSDAPARPAAGSSGGSATATTPSQDAADEPAPGTVGARSGALSTAGQLDEADAPAYLEWAGAYGRSPGECPTWVHYRWAQISDEQGWEPPEDFSGNGGELADRAPTTLSRHQAPGLGAMISTPHENHVMIVERIERLEGTNSYRYTVSEVNWPRLASEDPRPFNHKNDRQLHFHDGEWTDHRQHAITGVVAADHPGAAR